MSSKIFFNFFLLAIILTPIISFSQKETRKTELEKLSTLYAAKEKNEAASLQKIAKQKGWALTITNKNSNRTIKLTGIDINGFPMYTGVDNNATSAATTHTNQLWNGGSTGYNLSGSSINMKGKLAEWDEGIAKANHIELDGKIVNKDGSGVANHSTHVAGTLVATGINPYAKGMAYNAAELDCYDFSNHISEIAGAASNLLLSNHSYGIIAGWNKNIATGDWEFWGNPGDTADYKLGIYDADTQMLDSISYNAPYYLIVKTSGNKRDENGPAVGTPYKRYDASGMMVDAGNRPIGISSNDGYDIIPTYGVAKNIITVGAVEGIASGSTKVNDIKISKVSSWGPTDDGRIKPDIVAAGVDVLSCSSDGTTAYYYNSGTSMAAPNVTGSLFLLQEFYSQKNAGAFMKAATLKALAIHTATEAGINDGPDYQYGWGLLNAEKAANIINKNATNGTAKIVEATLNNGATYALNVIASGDGKLMATVAWTDPVGAVTTTNLLNNPSLKLINDLDIRIVKAATTYLPWVLNPAIPNAAATKGDNFRDNVERVEVENVVPGQAYTIIITHKGTLQRGSQVFGLIISGIGGTTYCTSAATQTQGTRIDNVTLANINNNNPVGCTSYTNFTNLTAQLQPNTTYPLSVAVSTCDGSISSKVIKVFIDYNSNGNFTDAGELVATSGIINTNTTFTTSITTPSNLQINSFSLMRVVVQETNDPTTVTPCSTYLQGETQDFLVQFMNAKFDAAIADISIPVYNNCASNNQYISVRINNVGDSSISNIPVTAAVKNGATTIATLSEIFKDSIASGDSKVYTFQTPFASVANATYNIAVTANLTNDQNTINNIKVSDIAIATTTTTSLSGDAKVCGATATLKAFNTNANQNYFWYNAATASNPIAVGTSTTTDSIASKYYVGSGLSTNIGAVSKNVFSDGSYQAKGGNYLKYTSTVPVLLENAKIYTAYPGKVYITVADLRRTLPDGSYTYTIIGTTTIDVTASRPTIARGDIAGNDLADLGRVYNINLLLPSGSHIIIVKTDSIANIFRNNNIASNPYPYSIPNIFTITGNNATNPSQYYYCLYNMAIRTLDCQGNKVAVVPTVAVAPVISYSGDSLVCTSGISYQWRKDGVDIVDAINQTYKPTINGNYSCYVMDIGSCQQLSNVLAYSMNSSNEFVLKPNPANNYIDVSFGSNATTNTEIYIVNAVGKICMQHNFTNTTGNFSERINVANLAAGVYVLNVLHGSETFRKKFVVVR